MEKGHPSAYSEKDESFRFFIGRVIRAFSVLMCPVRKAANGKMNNSMQDTGE